MGNMRTWRLWRTLQNPLTHHPLYWRPAFHSFSFAFIPTWLLVSAVLVLVAGVVGFPNLFRPLAPLCVFTPVLMIIGTVFSANSRGILWTLGISSVISHQRTWGASELIYVSPIGALGTVWVLASRCLHYKDRFDGLRTIILSLMLAASVIFACPLVTFFVLLFRYNPLQALSLLSVTSVLLPIYYVDYVQTTLVSCLTGMLAATQTRSRIEARIWALGLFLLCQLATYSLSFLLIFNLLPRLYNLLDFAHGVADVSLPPLALLIFYLLREGIITMLWRLLTIRLNTDLSELDEVVYHAQ